MKILEIERALIKRYRSKLFANKKLMSTFATAKEKGGDLKNDYRTGKGWREHRARAEKVQAQVRKDRRNP